MRRALPTIGLGETTMKSRIALAVALGCVAATAAAQQPSSAFDRGKSQQSWQNPGLAAVLEKCSNKPQPFRISGDGDASTAVAPPPPALPTPGRYSRRHRRESELEGRLGVGRQQRRRPHRRRGRQDPVREPGREQRHGARSRDRPRESHPRQHQHRRRVVAQQERRVVRRVARLGRRDPPARAATQGAREHRRRRAARLRRRRGERPHGRQPRRRLPGDLRAADCFTPTRKAS